MNRRSFLVAASAFLTLPQMPQGTPMLGVTPPAPDSRPNPIYLGSGITLLDFRIHPGSWATSIIGEIRNENTAIIDSPTVSISYDRQDGSSGFTWLSPIIPVMEPGRAIPIFGPIREEDTDRIYKINTTFDLCTVAQRGPYSAREEAMSLDVSVTGIRAEPLDYRYRAKVRNLSEELVSDAAARGIVRDETGRIAGTTNMMRVPALRPNAATMVTLVANPKASANIRANPFVLMNGADYSVEVVIGSLGPTMSPGCTMNFPWHRNVTHSDFE